MANVAQNVAAKAVRGIADLPNKLKRKAASRGRVKDHVSAKGTTLRSQLVPKFGITEALIDRACKGDADATLQIGELGRQGRKMSEFAPTVAEKVVDLIEGTQAYNEAIATILTTAGTGATAIDKAQNRVELADVRFVNDRTLRELEFEGAKVTQRIKYNYAFQDKKLKNEIDKRTATVNGSYTSLQRELNFSNQDVINVEAHTVNTAKRNLELGSKAIHQPLKQFGGNAWLTKAKEVLFGY